MTIKLKREDFRAWLESKPKRALKIMDEVTNHV